MSQDDGGPLIDQPYYQKLEQRLQSELQEVKDRNQPPDEEECLQRLCRWSEYIQAREADGTLGSNGAMWEWEYLRRHFFGRRCISILMERDDEMAHTIRKGLRIPYHRSWPNASLACLLFRHGPGWIQWELERPRYPGIDPLPGKVWPEETEEGARIQKWIDDRG